VAIADPAEVGEAVARLCRASRREMVSMHDPAASSAAAAADVNTVAASELDRDMLRRGVAIRQISAWGGCTSPASMTEERRLNDAGAAVRLTRSVPFKLSMFDRSVALLPLQTATRTLHHGALLVRDPAVINVLLAASRAAWAGAAPLVPRAGLPEHLRPVVATLLDGLVDTAAARRLGMSSRTYSRRVAELLEHLDVRSRAQVGAAIEQRLASQRRATSP
jgi:hypothetical protein